MPTAGHAVVALDDAAWSASPGGFHHASLTAALGATQTAVDAYRLSGGVGFDLPDEPEQLLVPVDTAATLVISSATSVPSAGLARIPAGVGATVRTDAVATVLVVAAPADPTPDAAPIAVDLDAVGFAVPDTSAVATAFLTAPLGCTGMKVNARRLEPDQAVPYHTEGDQEELFIPTRGPAAMCLAGERHSTPVGTVTRVAPAVPRSARNDGDRDAVWIMVGAPPTGGPTDWDPGAEVCD